MRYTYLWAVSVNADEAIRIIGDDFNDMKFHLGLIYGESFNITKAERLYKIWVPNRKNA